MFKNIRYLWMMYILPGSCFTILQQNLSLRVWGVADDQEWQYVKICWSCVSDDYTTSPHYYSLSTFVYLWNFPWI